MILFPAVDIQNGKAVRLKQGRAHESTTFAESPVDVNLTPWTVTNAEFFRALQVERVTMFIILSLIVLVAAFNIITGQMMLVNDKNQVETREVVATQAVGDKWLITSGLKPGDKVIVSGLQKVRPGVTVKAEAERTAPAVQ